MEGGHGIVRGCTRSFTGREGSYPRGDLMRTDETGEMVPSTLGEYRDLCAAIAPDSRAVQFLDSKIGESPHGRDEIVVASDSQMRLLLMPMLLQKRQVEGESWTA